MTKHLAVKRTVWALVVALAVFVAANAVLVGVAHMSLKDTANQAAFNAASAVMSLPYDQATAEAAQAAAQQYAQSQGAQVIGDVTLHPDGSVTVEVAKTSPNLLLTDISFAKQFAHVAATETSAGIQG